MDRFISLAYLLLLSFVSHTTCAQILNVGPNQTYPNIRQAANDAQPGDTILIHPGTYSGGLHIENLQGNPDAWITIKPVQGYRPVFDGGTNLQFSDARYVHIDGIEMTAQTGNAMNLDDGGSYATPTMHIHITNCYFHDLNANGNNDLLKLSGLDSFLIEGCLFMNGAEGGSGIDMVGCHHGIIRNNHFENMGSNSIQAKGGTQHILIRGNRFVNGGLRNINLGGSTGLQFFRPLDATFEAADLQVHANVFEGGWAGLAYVGSTRVDVANNTFVNPANWVFRILQETVDPARFISCGDNWFRNNIIYYGDVHRDVNIGGNTRPESFVINNNLWYNHADDNFIGPDLPVTDTDAIVQEDPLFEDLSSGAYNLMALSPAIGKAVPIEGLQLDNSNHPYLDPPSIGAFEGGEAITNIRNDFADLTLLLYPNPTDQYLFVSVNQKIESPVTISITDMQGYKVFHQISENKLAQNYKVTLPSVLPKGIYQITLKNKTGSISSPFVIQ